MSDFKLHNIQPTYTMSFSTEKEVVAKLFWTEGVLSHEGNLDASVEIFLDLVNKKGLTQYNELKLKIDQLENQLSTAKAQNEIYRSALNN